MVKYGSIGELPDDLKKNLSKYFTNVGGNTFCIVGLPNEVTGGALARYSRAKTGMQLTIVNEFLDEHGEPSQAKGSALMDRVLNAYGDDSVGELEGVHVGIEEASMLLLKEIEDRRIGGSPIEQSTRYVKYDAKDGAGNWRYLRPKEIIESKHGETFIQTCDRAFEVYSELVERLSRHFEGECPEASFTIQAERNGKMVDIKKSELQGAQEERAFRIGYNFTIRCAALDVGRCVLPTATKSHVGIYGNGRFFTALLSHLKSIQLDEAKARALELEHELRKVIPTFIKRNKAQLWTGTRDERMRALVRELFVAEPASVEDVSLIEEKPLLDTFCTSAAYPYSQLPYSQLLRITGSLSKEQKERLVTAYTGERKERRERTGRAAETGYPYLFDLIGTFAEYRDLERHRMCTQQRQLLSTNLGFLLPPEVTTVGMADQVSSLVQEMEALHRKLREDGLLLAAQYATLFNHRIRWTMGMNLRELQHLTELRTGVNGHHGYRAMAMAMAKQALGRDPWIKSMLSFVDYSDPGNKIARAREQARIQGKNLGKGVDGGTDY